MKYFTVYDLFKEIGKEHIESDMNQAGEHLKALAIERGIPTMKKHFKPLECKVVHYPEEYKEELVQALRSFFKPKRKRIAKVEKIN